MCVLYKMYYNLLFLWKIKSCFYDLIEISYSLLPLNLEFRWIFDLMIKNNGLLCIEAPVITL